MIRGVMDALLVRTG